MLPAQSIEIRRYRGRVKRNNISPEFQAVRHFRQSELCNRMETNQKARRFWHLPQDRVYRNRAGRSTKRCCQSGNSGKGRFYPEHPQEAQGPKSIEEFVLRLPANIEFRPRSDGVACTFAAYCFY